jgi:hypothetical protein
MKDFQDTVRGKPSDDEEAVACLRSATDAEREALLVEA